MPSYRSLAGSICFSGRVRKPSFCAFQAAKETRYKMGPAAETITLIHFNDVYNVESREQEPVGGAARFSTAIKSFEDRAPIVLFSGDIFAPSISEYILTEMCRSKWIWARLIASRSS